MSLLKNEISVFPDTPYWLDLQIQFVSLISQLPSFIPQSQSVPSRARPRFEFNSKPVVIIVRDGYALGFRVVQISVFRPMLL